jgi:hypothetical protein
MASQDSTIIMIHKLDEKINISSKRQIIKNYTERRMVYTCRFSGVQIRGALLFEHKSAPDNNLPFQPHRYITGN